MLPADILTDKVISFEVVVNLDLKDVATISLLNKRFHQRVNLILKTKQFCDA